VIRAGTSSKKEEREEASGQARPRKRVDLHDIRGVKKNGKSIIASIRKMPTKE